MRGFPLPLVKTLHGGCGSAVIPCMARTSHKSQMAYPSCCHAQASFPSKQTPSAWLRSLPWLRPQRWPCEAGSAEHFRPVKSDFSMGSKHISFGFHGVIQCSALGLGLMRSMSPPQRQQLSVPGLPLRAFAPQSAASLDASLPCSSVKPNTQQQKRERRNQAGKSEHCQGSHGSQRLVNVSWKHW